MDKLAVYALLLCPFDPTPFLPHQIDKASWASLKEIAIEQEIVGKHERWVEDFRSEFAYVRRHWSELMDAPAMCEADRLPPHWFCSECDRFNAFYQANLERRWCLESHRREAIEDAICESRRLREVWDLLVVAECANNSWAVRRGALKKLRDDYPEEFYAGVFPPCVPVWRFDRE